uniref:Uncharacterized protein n=1 Tax=Caenorhabditis japonica TaxID=281687 RepID=A0A8R1HRN3_CAEJA
MSSCANANLPDDVVIGAWELFYHAYQRVTLEGSEEAWQLAAIYYYFLSKGVKRRGKPSRILTQPIPVSMLTIIEAFDVSVMEVLDKTVRFIEIIHSRKIRRFLDYIRRIQESLAVSCIIFKKFVAVYCEIFTEIRTGTSNCPSSHELLTLLWTSFLVMKTRLPNDDLISNYQMMFSMLDHFYTEICSMKDGIVHHLNQKTTTKDTYDEFLLSRGSIDERVFIPSADNFNSIFRVTYEFQSSNALKRSLATGKEFIDAEFLNQIQNKQCLDKISLSQQKSGADRVSLAREHPRVPPAEFSLEIGSYPDDENASETNERLKRIIGNWELETSQLTKVCEQMSDNPMATLLLKRDVMTEKFEHKLSTELGEPSEHSVLNRYHHTLRLQLEQLFMVYIEKIIVAELKKKVREEDLLNVVRREDFLDSVFCFCVELILFCNNYLRPFPWSAWLCDIHPFHFHKVIDLMINHEKSLSRTMVQHFNRIEENVIDYYAWKEDSPLWPMLVRCPFSHFQEFGDDWNDKCELVWRVVNTYSPLKFTPVKKDQALRDELGRPLVPNNQSSRTLRIFLKRTLFTGARRMQELTDRVSMGVRAKSQCWSLFDYLLRNEPLIFMDRHLDQIILCAVYVILKINVSGTTFLDLMAHYRRQAKDAVFVYRNVTIFSEQLEENGKVSVNTKETVMERLEGPQKEKETVNLIRYYNLEFRDRIKYIIGHLDQASDEDLLGMPLPTSYGLLPVRVHLTDKLSIQMLPKTAHGTTKQEKIIANLEANGVSFELQPGHNVNTVAAD